MAYVLITEHMTGKQQDELDALLAGLDAPGPRRERARTAAVLGGDVVKAR
ncbi:MAG: hypothetical protein AB7L91_06270 [Dehalococcoidia bacterium]